MAPAKKKAKAAPAKAAPAKSGNKGGGAYLFALVGLIVLGLMIFAAPALLLFAVGVIPAMGAYVVDREPGRNATLAVAAANFAGVAPFIFELLGKRPDHGPRAGDADRCLRDCRDVRDGGHRLVAGPGDAQGRDGLHRS